MAFSPQSSPLPPADVSLYLVPVVLKARQSRHLLWEISKAFLLTEGIRGHVFSVLVTCLFLSGHLAVYFHCVDLCLPVNSVTFERRGSVQLITVSPVSTSDTVLSYGVG